MSALRIMGRLVLWLSVVLGAGVAFAWSWDHADRVSGAPVVANHTH